MVVLKVVLDAHLKEQMGCLFFALKLRLGVLASNEKKGGLVEQAILFYDPNSFVAPLFVQVRRICEQGNILSVTTAMQFQAKVLT